MLIPARVVLLLRSITICPGGATNSIGSMLSVLEVLDFIYLIFHYIKILLFSFDHLHILTMPLLSPHPAAAI